MQTIYKTFYACDQCKKEYDETFNAMACENLPLLEEINGLKQYEVQDSINFNDEYPMGSRWVYQTSSGIIVKKHLIRQGEHHQYVYWTDGGAGVIWVQDDYGWKLFSPAEAKKRNYQY